MLAAAAAWHHLSLELDESVRGHTSVLTSLGETWRGPAATAMGRAAAPYVDWMDVIAARCQQVGSSVHAVVAAFESTRFAVVHPCVVFANRTRLVFLLATNFFGINLPTIAETEAEYQAMWANNSAAMYRYAASSANAVIPVQFSSPPPIANPAGLAGPAAVAPSASSSGLLTSIPAAAGDLVDSAWFQLANAWLNQGVAAGGFPVNMLAVLAVMSQAQGLQSLGGDIGAGLSQSAADFAAVEARLAGALGAAGSAWAPTGSMGGAVLVGKLMTPPSVVGLLPASEPQVRLVSAVSPLSADFSRMPIAMPPAGRAPASAGGRRRGGRDYDDIQLGSELLGTVMQRPPSAG
ncbi:MAG: PPE family protein, partial [Mycobacterium sp.]|nr:PPE family protein [Mycobacterium sp.]